MPQLVKSFFLKVLLIVAILNILMCPITFFGGTYIPKIQETLESLVCPPGMSLDRVTRSESDLRGKVMSLDAACARGYDKVDVTGKVAIFACGLPILGAILFVVWLWFSPPIKKKDQDSLIIAE